MCEDPGAGGTLSADELASLTRLFRQFEGASDPLAIQCARRNQSSPPSWSDSTPKRLNQISRVFRCINSGAMRGIIVVCGYQKKDRPSPPFDVAHAAA